jgi:hypothetical protein
MTKQEEIAQLEKQIADIRKYGQCIMPDGEVKVFTHYIAALSAVCGRERHIARLKAEQ